MSDNGSGAYELKHHGKIHRVSNLSELKDWILESRVTTEDSFRAAGSEEWLPVMTEPEFSSILKPDNQWIVTMETGVFKAYQFETIIKWAEEGRVTEDAVVEGPRTPPGGVKASALPALASNLRRQMSGRPPRPVLRIDGREFPAVNTETIRRWIEESRVPLEAEISLEGKDWEPVSSCGLFDLEDWPVAAHGRVEEESLPEMPECSPGDTAESHEPILREEQPETEAILPEQPFREIRDITEEDDKAEEVPYIVISGDSEVTIESVAKLKSLIKKKVIFSYDQVRHPSITEETISVGELLDSFKSSKRSPIFWILCGLAGVAAVASALEYFKVLDFVTWL
ncbi:MAG: hypothetical protein K8S62_06720 [Candidatus Sabulitectum sp.]|nr:hypothetical protein [Candidatus Sabulitectum sp.]